MAERPGNRHGCNANRETLSKTVKKLIKVGLLTTEPAPNQQTIFKVIPPPDVPGAEDKESKMGTKRTICVDFDGVIHSYKSGWKGATVIPDPPVISPETGQSAIEWLCGMILHNTTDLESVAETLEVCIYSSRSKEPGGIEAMKEWLSRHGLSDQLTEMIRFPTQKPAAFLTIDDRAWCFTGIFPTTDEIMAFKPWYAQDEFKPKPKSLCFIDVETTGLSWKKHEIVELAAIRVRLDTWETEGTLDLKVRPEHIHTAEPKALELNGYDPEKWKGAYSLGAVLEQLSPLLQGAIPAGHNVKFDLAFIEAAWERGVAFRPSDLNYHTLDTCSLAMPLYINGKVNSVELGDVYRCLFGHEQPDQHRALSDCRASMEIAKALIGVSSH
jgi:DNA polymerase III epsilon subunit-like protein